MKIVFSKKVKYKGAYRLAGVEFEIDPADMPEMAERGGTVISDSKADATVNPSKKGKTVQKRDD